MVTLFSAIGLAALAAYSYVLLPFPFYQVIRGLEPAQMPPLRWRVWAALRQPRPVLDVKVDEIRALRRIFVEPRRPFVSWRGSLGYYDRKSRPEHRADDPPRLVFRSRAALVLLVVRLPLDHLLSWVFNTVNLILYGGVLVFGFGLARWAAWRHRDLLAAQPEAEAAVLLAQIEQHLTVFVPPVGDGPIGIMAEPGYFFFKLAEGRLFRIALRRFGSHHPNCEIGPDDGPISALHLGAVDHFDAGLNTESQEMAPTAKSYGEIREGFIEDRPFGDSTFAALYMVHVVDHIYNLDPAMAAAAAMLAPRGRVFFSGLSHDFHGWWLEKFVAAGAVSNNQPLEWYDDVCRRHGLVPLWSSYCQAFPGNLIFKCTYGFAMKTRVWTILGLWFGASPARRQWLRRFIRALWTDLHRLDSALVARQGKGLNFIVVAERLDSSDDACQDGHASEFAIKET